MSARQRVLVTLLTLSAAGFSAWKVSEGDGPVAVRDGVEVHLPYIPTKGDVPTIGHGSTRYEDGTPVKLTDEPIPRLRAKELALNLAHKDCAAMARSIPGVKLHLEEFDLYCDFTGQYGIGNWRSSSMRTNLLAGNYVQACNSLLKWRFAAKYDCSTTINGKPNTRCWGVWTRQLERYQKCMAVQ